MMPNFIWLYTPRNTDPGYVYHDRDRALAQLLVDEGYSTVEALIEGIGHEVEVEYSAGGELIIDDGGASLQEVEVRG